MGSAAKRFCFRETFDHGHISSRRLDERGQVEYGVPMSPASPYRIPGERPVWVEPVLPRAAEPPRPPESDADIETIACECDAPSERYVVPPREILVGMAFIGAALVVATAASVFIVWLSRLAAS